MPKNKKSARSKSPSKRAERKPSNPQLAAQSAEAGNRKINVVAEAPELGPSQPATTEAPKPTPEKQEKQEKSAPEKQEKPTVRYSAEQSSCKPG